MDILQRIAHYTRERVARAKEEVSPAVMREQALACGKAPVFPFEEALKQEGPSFICECKKASPSKGIISPDFPYLQIAQDYEVAGAAAISVLTEPKWFQGSNRYLDEITQTVDIPVLRKDFVVDEYLIDEAKVLNASAVLLICSLLSQQELTEYLQRCDSLGLSALVEAHDADEVAMACDAGARIIGINNRNLKDFTVDFENSLRLRALIPGEKLCVAESGIDTPEDVTQLYDYGFDALLVGERLMRTDDRIAALEKLRGYSNDQG